MKVIYCVLCIVLLVASAVVAEVYDYGSGSDNVELEEEFGDVFPVLTSLQLGLLAGSSVSTDVGSTDTTQSFRFGNALTALQSPKVSYVNSDDGVVDSFLLITSGTTETTSFFEYELTFDDGFDSGISSTDTLEDFEDVEINLLGDTYTIVDTEINKGTSLVSIKLAASAITDYLQEGNVAVYTVGANKYEVKVTTISDNPKSVRLDVNGADIGALEEKDFYHLADDTILGIRKILSSSGASPDVVSLFVGAQVLEFEDHFDDSDFEQGFSLDQEKVTSGFVSLKGSVSGSSFTMTSLKYRGASSLDLYIGNGERLSTKLDDPSVLFGNWDLLYNGFKTVSETQIIIDSTDDLTFDLTFKNDLGSQYKVPLYNKDGSLGDGTRSLRVVEGSSSSDFNVSLKDYMILSTGSSKTDKSFVVQYDSVDVSNKKVLFTEVLSTGGNQITATYSDSSVTGAIGEGTVTVGGTGFQFYVQNDSSYKLAIDLDSDGSVSSTAVDIITEGGAIIDVGTSQDPGTTYTMKVTTDGSDLEESSANQATSFELSGGSAVGISPTDFSGLTMYSEGSKSSAMSTYGAEFLVVNTNAANAGSLTINYPLQQRFANVKFELLTASSTTTGTEKSDSTCFDGLQNGDEIDIDCGGVCPGCIPLVCLNGELDDLEDGVDCGGVCPDACTETQEASQDTGQGAGTETGGPTAVDDPECILGCVYVTEDDIIICVEVGGSVGKLYCQGPGELVESLKNGATCASDQQCLSGTCNEQVCGRRTTPLATGLNIALIIFALLAAFKLHGLLK